MKKLEFLHPSRKKILAINGSHRNGNTQFALTKMINLFDKNFSSTQGILVNLYERKINYATEADYGRPKFLTENQDDMHLMYSLMQSADVLIFGSPIYFYSVSGKMKTYIDRCNKYFWQNKLKDKFVFTVVVGGSTEPTEMINSLNKFYQMLETKNIGHQYFRAERADDLSKNFQAIKKLQQRVKQIAAL